MKPTFYPLKVSDVRTETAECSSIAFDVPADLKEAYTFLPGQYLTMKAMINGEEVRRSYSICTSPLENELRVAIKVIPEGRFSTFANKVLKVGDTLDVMTPTGMFNTEVSATNKKHYVGFAAGSGITPIMSIMRTVLEQEPESQFTLYYGNKNTGSIIFKEQIEALKNKYLQRLSVHYFLSREILDMPMFNGRIDREKCDFIFNNMAPAAFIDECFVCGPEEMIFSVRDSLRALNFDESKLHFELFTTSATKMAAANKPKVSKEQAGKVTDVTVMLDGKGFKFDLPFGTDNILDAALKQGADLPFACKGGVCCTCKAKVLEGEVEMVVNYALEKEEVEQGFVLTCQAFPKSEKVVIDFDTW